MTNDALKAAHSDPMEMARRYSGESGRAVGEPDGREFLP